MEEDQKRRLISSDHLNQTNSSINILRGEVSDSNLTQFEIIRKPKKQICSRFRLDQTSHIRGKNYTINSKYNIITFIPLVLYQQFKYFFNLYFLCLTLTQFVPALRVGFLFNYIGPLSLVLFLSMAKEAYDDILRHLRDNAINNQKYTLSNGRQIKCKDLQVGMIVHVAANQRIPADLLVLHADNKDGHTFVRTDQLDGETDWKLRKAPKMTQELDIQDYKSQPIKIKYELPSANIYNFLGNLTRYDQSKMKESLSIENVLWASTVLACNPIRGLVIYVGPNTRISLNSKLPQSKIGRFDREVDNLAKLLFLLMISLTSVVTFFSQPVLTLRGISVMFVRYLVLLSNIIPISMRVNLEFAKLVYSIRINRDKSIEGSLARNSTIPEELGRIDYLLSDKTGTLTQNEMVFKKLSLLKNHYSMDHKQNLLEDLQIVDQQNQNSRLNNQILNQFVTCLAVCHNVTPTVNESGVRDFQASSPDEVSLVKFVEEVGFQIISRDQSQITLQVGNQELTYEILENFPFSSESKRMGIIVKHNDQITFFIKGADTVIRESLSDGNQKQFVSEECENLARDGLRTLVCASRSLSQLQYDEWKKEYQDANCKLNNREEYVSRAIKKLERQLYLLGVTGVQDKFQDDVAQTVENLRNASIKVWMLTGDKLETAICCAIGSGIKSPNQPLMIIRCITDEIQLKTLLGQYEQNPLQLLVIDGQSLQLALDFYEEYFFKIAAKANSVVCCRCSPTQKAKVATLLRKYTSKVVACIGDGGNDVGMIQQSDVGIGIEGKEGKQAALASDFSIPEFKCLNQLLLWHGRLSYKRSSLLSQFIVHRGLLITSVQAIFMFIFYFLSISVFSGPLMLGYSTFFTMFPVFCIIFDEDVANSIALKYPPLYATLQKGRQLNPKTFFIWLWKAIYQGFFIMILSMLFIENAFLRIQTTAFTCLIITQYLMLLTELNSLHIVMIVMVALSLTQYIVVIWSMKGIFQVATLNWFFFAECLLIMVISWVPLYIVKLIMRYLDPSDYEKKMKNVQRDRIRVNI